jgi:NAD(P)-dependent dehydrogenase (short-subunit alcohol dehydrogenase family)
MDLELTNRIAVVTGASKGIGLAVTRSLVEEGAHVVATSRNRSPDLDALGGVLLHVPVDYGAVKAALINLTKALAEEFGPQGIRVNGVCPGPVLTPWWTDDGGAAEIFAAHVGSDRDSVLTTVAPELMQLTTGRLADAQEIADAVAFLASPRSASTVGVELLVDLGMIKAV